MTPMALSIFDLFTIGIGPSSSHTVGPMRAARFFANRVLSHAKANDVTRVSAELYGSLGLTGRGHGTGKAVLLGWLGEKPDKCDPDSVPAKLEKAEQTQSFLLGGKHNVVFISKRDIVYNRRTRLPWFCRRSTRSNPATPLPVYRPIDCR